MIYQLDSITLRPLEPDDLDALYQQKNDPEVARLLDGFATGYARSDIRDWHDYHHGRKDEVMWAIIVFESQRCIGHVGLYQIDFRVGKANFGIMIGDKAYWGQGIGTLCTQFAVDYGFRELNLNRIELTVLDSNQRAIQLYRKIGFREEGKLRQAQYKRGQYHDIVIMAILRDEYTPELLDNHG
jgi:RimJ/RimL family protein N-acetyltransferase